MKVVAYAPRHRRVVSRFIHNKQTRTHYHLDWHPSSTWIGNSPAVLAFDNPEQLIGLLMFAPARQGITWLRLVALHEDANPSVFTTLLANVNICDIEEICVLENEFWLQSLLVANGFKLIERIIHLQRPAGDAPATAEVMIERAHRRDLGVVEKIDHAAFGIYWQMQLSDLLRAIQYASSFTVASLNGQLVGYQFSTAHASAIHLARLATLPSHQRRGVGTALVADLIERFPKRMITVNTQASNEKSLHLYKRLGFRRQSWITPVWKWANHDHRLP